MPRPRTGDSGMQDINHGVVDKYMEMKCKSIGLTRLSDIMDLIFDDALQAYGSEEALKARVFELRLSKLKQSA